ncbi:hypothetical protein Cfor_08996 [Coptotermes formosanus]|uniref:Rab-GAP TBC domain-containing protein n=1 Tax=Coptotermes formosanus TaxID=36987 RepID=A0A6L2Q4Z4_COPFO|nr:hypothetical protein Cfor_08996 [Coptotermes formosanus]
MVTGSACVQTDSMHVRIKIVPAHGLRTHSLVTHAHRAIHELMSLRFLPLQTSTILNVSQTSVSRKDSGGTPLSEQRLQPSSIPYEQRVALQDQLTRLILRVIIKYPHLRYYQGYHDVAVTFLLVVGEAVAFQIMEKLSTEHLKDCMEPTMDKTSRLLNYIYPLICRVHPELYEYMERSGVGTMFCLPWFLTWYGHSLNQYRDVVRLYDYFLASPPLMPLYVAAALVVHRCDEIFSVDCDMASIHSLLSQIPDDLPFESLLKQATRLHEDYPPASLEAEVQERFTRELQLRRYDNRPPTARIRRHNIGAFWYHVAEMNRLLPHWGLVPRIAVPRFRSPFVLATTVALIGLYAYLHMTDAVIVNNSPPVS